MCLRTSSVIGTSTPNWDGDRIEQSPVIEAARLVPSTQTRYPIDVREYLSTSGNHVVHAAIEAAVDALPNADARGLFWSHRPGAYDHRVRTVCGHLASTIGYQRRKRHGLKEWLFPDETLAAKEGDCEDHAFLLGAMLLASGVSGYVVRIALGKLHDTTLGEATDHAWVMYKSEAGHWLLLDPFLYTTAARSTKPRAATRLSPRAKGPIAARDSRHEYVPHFVFNDAHLWAVVDRGQAGDLQRYLDERTFWEEFDPSFAAAVHGSIYDEALAGMSWVDRQWVNAASLAIDANLAIYDPRDHFDDAYVEDAWDRVGRRLASGDLNDFALACHAIGDFYAHSSWGVFRDGASGRPPIDARPPAFRAPDYSSTGPFPIADARFSVNEPAWGGRARDEAVGLWAGKIVSGRYAQASDPHQALFERLTYIPSELCDRPDYADRAGLPHHDEIAVDEAKRGDRHRLYADDEAYAAAFRERFDAAVAHVRGVYEAWKTRR